MITRHHVALTILCTMILCSTMLPADPFLILVIYTGAVMGTILPDIQMKKPRVFQTRTIAWAVSRFSSTVVTPHICRLYQIVWGCTCNPGDKRLTHSVPGILFLSVILAAFLLVPAFILTGGSGLHLPEVFLCGCLIGIILHQTEDMCTRKGITPLFPFSTITVSGSIRPCDTTDRRIAQFHFYHCSVAGIFLGFQYLGSLQGIASVLFCLFGLGTCLGMMIWSSDVRISREWNRDQVNEIRTPVLSDPFITRWKADHAAPGLQTGVYYFNKKEQ
jgi:hypothetical protein